MDRLPARMRCPHPTRLAECMKAAGLNDPQLAKATGTTKQQIFKLRRGERKMTVEWARRLAPRLGVSWQDVIEPDDPREARPPVSGPHHTPAALSGIVDIGCLETAVKKALQAYAGRGPRPGDDLRRFIQIMLLLYDDLTEPHRRPATPSPEPPADTRSGLLLNAASDPPDTEQFNHG